MTDVVESKHLEYYSNNLCRLAHSDQNIEETLHSDVLSENCSQYLGLREKKVFYHNQGKYFYSTRKHEL